MNLHSEPAPVRASAPVQIGASAHCCLPCGDRLPPRVRASVHRGYGGDARMASSALPRSRPSNPTPFLLWSYEMNSTASHIPQPSAFDIRLYKRAVAKALACYPDLDAFGFTLVRRARASLTRRAYAEIANEGFLDPAKILDRVAAFRRGIDYMCDDPRKGAGHGSYTLKHRAECGHVYVPNGVMILALIHLGVPLERDGPNAVVKPPHRGPWSTSAPALHHAMGQHPALTSSGRRTIPDRNESSNSRTTQPAIGHCCAGDMWHRFSGWWRISEGTSSVVSVRCLLRQDAF